MNEEIDVVQAAVEQQRRLLADARRRRGQAASALLDAEHAVSKLELERDAATQASRTDRNSASLAADMSHTNARLLHARADLRDATAADAATAAEVATAEANLAEAERAVEREQLAAELALEDFSNASKEDADAIVDGVVAIRERIVAIRARIEADGATVRRFHAMGGSVSLRPRDASTPAGYLAAALLRHGGRLGQHENVHAIRHMLDVPSPSSPIYDPTHATAQLVRFIIDALTQGARDVQAGAPDRGRRALDDIARVWVHARDFASAREAQEILDRGRAKEIADENRLAHENRLAVAHAQTLPRRGRPVDKNGSPVPPPPGVPQHRPFPVGTANTKIQGRIPLAGEAPDEPRIEADVADLGGGDGAFIPEGSVEGPAIETPVQSRKRARRSPPARQHSDLPAELAGDAALYDALGDGDGAFIPEGSEENPFAIG